MKKLLTLALALAMVFAIAAPAMAAWNAPAATGAPYSIKVTAVQENKDAYGHIYYTALPANAAVVAGTPVKVMVEANIPTKAKLDAQYGEQNGATEFSFELKLTNLTVTGVTQSLKLGDNDPDTDPQILTKNGKASINSLMPLAEAQVYTAIVSCTVDETKAAKFEAILGYDVSEGFLMPFGLMNGYLVQIPPDDKETPVFVYASMNDDNLFTIGNFAFEFMTDANGNYAFLREPGNPASFWNTAVVHDTETDNCLVLTLDKDGKVLTWEISIGHYGPNPIYRILGDVFVNTTDGKIYTPGMTDTADAATYAALVAALKVFTDNFGFKPSDTVYFTEGNILSTFGLNGTVSDYVEFRPYGASLTVSDAAAVPNTGDSVSVIGFVMVGLALLATAAVVVRKVRA